MRDPENIRDVLTLQPDYIGFIFYPASKRFVGSSFDANWMAQLEGPNKTGVFVDADEEQVNSYIRQYGFHAVQLHGNEAPAYCARLKATGTTVIKAFGIDERFDWARLGEYEHTADYYLFDTQSKQHGGTGMRFNWKLLEGYTFEKPFFLSGGIGIENIQEALKIDDDRLYALDLNSKFETAPGIKDIELLKQTLQTINDE
ncbi:phosphoribosylanthranilate isomerase [Parapedobacter indicus]|uniref:N-(5'-phosphoribosyl)anthranilate isomerase n=1 Tax=Parapedobacter indicus TaxID=1477437 RepID=A0A1I3D225_9SPHI|nr:phosphoribosylanthranilate isomerase [Parapedobacter indicus]SFH80755.1 phosphoribosylanthranilate isomerase [Parapedobacter indicus]